MTYLTKETIDERIARVISQKQDYEEIEEYRRYRINEKTLEVWDTRLDREVKPHSKKNRAAMLAPTAITWHNTLADLNRYYGRQAQMNMMEDRIALAYQVEMIKLLR
ncbi:MAG: hypothetical protein EZS28_043686, partial [Streblomastix strix]